MIKIILVELNLTAAPAGRFHRVCSAAHDIIYEGNEYTAVGDLMEIEDIETTAELANIGTTITLSGIDPAYRREIDQNGFKRAPIKIFAADLDENTNIVTNATLIHAGTCDTPITDVDYDTGIMTIGISTISIWGELDKTPNLNRSSYATHAALHCYNEVGEFIPDEIYKYVASVSTEEQWKS